MAIASDEVAQAERLTCEFRQFFRRLYYRDYLHSRGGDVNLFPALFAVWPPDAGFVLSEFTSLHNEDVVCALAIG